MKKFAVMLSLVVGIWVLIPAPQAHASWLGDKWEALVSWFQSRNAGEKLSTLRRHHHLSKTPPKASVVPELDPSAAGGAMILLLGGVAYIASRRREEDLV